MPTNRVIEKAEVDIYANTLIDQLSEAGGIEAVLEARTQMEQIVAYNRSHVELSNAASEATYTPEQRANLVRNVFEGVSPALQGVLGLMAERGGLEKLPRVLSTFNNLISEKMGVTVVDVKTRVPLDSHLREVITKKAQSDLGGEVVLREQVDPSMLGGVILSTGSKRIDASMGTMLENARNVLKQS